MFTPEGITYAGGKTGGWHRNRKSVAVGGGGAMTEASKRRCEEGFEFVEDFEAILAEKETLDAIADFNRGAIGPHRVPVGHHGSPHQFPVGKQGCLNAAVPLPANTSDSAWDDTLCELPSVVNRCMSYSDMRDAAKLYSNTVYSIYSRIVTCHCLICNKINVCSWTMHICIYESGAMLCQKYF